MTASRTSRPLEGTTVNHSFPIDWNASVSTLTVLSVAGTKPKGTS